MDCRECKEEEGRGDDEMNAVHLEKCPSLGYRFRHFLFYFTPSIIFKPLFYTRNQTHKISFQQQYRFIRGREPESHSSLVKYTYGLLYCFR